MLGKYKVIYVTKDIVKYPEYKEDTLKYKDDLPAYLEDDIVMFIVHEESGYIIESAGFFYEIVAQEFVITK